MGGDGRAGVGNKAELQSSSKVESFYEHFIINGKAMGSDLVVSCRCWFCLFVSSLKGTTDIVAWTCVRSLPLAEI